MTRTIYLPSILRQKPILVADNMNGRILAPLPQLVLYRATSGLFYDIVKGGTPMINDANARFEEYCRKLIGARCPLFEVQASHKYKLGKNWDETPDVLVKLDGQIELVFECKATKLTYAAQYADDPISEAKNAYTQIAKGVYQIWKFFSHARRGLFAAETVSPKARGALLTMEAFGQLWGGMQQRILHEATVLASVDPEITEEDRRPVVFCTIQELDDVLAVSDEQDILASFDATRDPGFSGWAIQDIRRKLAPGVERKQFPFPLGDVMPWYNKLGIQGPIHYAPDIG